MAAQLAYLSNKKSQVLRPADLIYDFCVYFLNTYIYVIATKIHNSQTFRLICIYNRMQTGQGGEFVFALKLYADKQTKCVAKQDQCCLCQRTYIYTKDVQLYKFKRQLKKSCFNNFFFAILFLLPHNFKLNTIFFLVRKHLHVISFAEKVYKMHEQ